MFINRVSCVNTVAPRKPSSKVVGLFVGGDDIGTSACGVLVVEEVLEDDDVDEAVVGLWLGSDVGVVGTALGLGDPDA